VRRVVTLALLLGGMRLILPLGSQVPGAEALLVFGFLILAAYTAGELVVQVGVPKIIGYLVAGLLFGPSVLGVVSTAATLALKPVGTVAIAFIAYLAGAELKWEELRRTGLRLLQVTGTELLVCFAVIGAVLLALAPWVPFLRALEPAPRLAAAAVFASIAVIHSPAVTMAMLSETGARGHVATTALGVVLLADLLVVPGFSVVLAGARGVLGGAAGAPSLWLTAWEVVGAIPIGVLLGVLVALYLRHVGREPVVFAALIAVLGMGLAEQLHVELLLLLLVAGFVSENLAAHRGDPTLREPMERSAAPVLVVFFALAGAKLELAELLALWPVVLPIAAARIGGIWLGTRLGARWAGLEPAPSRLMWTGLVSQAGVAIGLVTIAAESFPDLGAAMRSLLLGVVAVNEAIGPLVFRWGLQRAGELVPGAAAARGPAHAH